MPEGDTIHRSAETLGKAIVGTEITAASCELFDAGTLVSRTVTAVEARGKHLLVHLDDERAILTHMRMTGSWHIYRSGERWQRPLRQARLVIETARWVAVCFNAPVVELLRRANLAGHRTLGRLGPDILSSEFSATDAAARLRARGEAAIGDALLSQRAVAGIGNVYKSETLFLCRLSPFARVGELDDETLVDLLNRTRKLMLANIDGYPRRTRGGPGGRLWVYGRGGRPCHVCQTRIRMRRQGADARSTYWCPECQGASL